VRQNDAIGREDFVQNAMVIRQRGQEQVSRWMKGLGYEKVSGILEETVLADDTRERSWAMGHDRSLVSSAKSLGPRLSPQESLTPSPSPAPSSTYSPAPARVVGSPSRSEQSLHGRLHRSVSPLSFSSII
jgi:hypothetical protein